MRTWEWYDPDLTRPIAAPLKRCAELLGVELAAVRKAAANVEPYVRVDGTKVWSLMQLERQLRPEAYGPRRPGGYVTRRRGPTARPERWRGDGARRMVHALSPVHAAWLWSSCSRTPSRPRRCTRSQGKLRADAVHDRLVAMSWPAP